jgi:hypothetical protein
MSKCVILKGNPRNGFSVVGPFNNADDACEWVFLERLGEWWIIPLIEPIQQISEDFRCTYLEGREVKSAPKNGDFSGS